MDVYLLPRSQASTNQSLSAPGRLDRMVAQGHVVIQQPGRRAEGQRLVYTASDDKFVLTGGPPSIFDAERGKITGVSLTFFRADDRVLVEGEASTPVVTQTRVARYNKKDEWQDKCVPWPQMKLANRTVAVAL